VLRGTLAPHATKKFAKTLMTTVHHGRDKATVTATPTEVGWEVTAKRAAKSVKNDGDVSN